MHEAKFLMGAIAGAMAENDRLFYLADYPMFGTIANINAFAIGAKMTNPRAKVYLDWYAKKGNRHCGADPKSRSVLYFRKRYGNSGGNSPASLVSIMSVMDVRIICHAALPLGQVLSSV